MGTEVLCEYAFRPLAQLVVLALQPLRMPPPAVVLAGTASGIGAAVELARGHLVVAALLVQAKTLLDNADGQLARLANRVTLLGRYLDSECDLLVDAALFAALGWYTHRPLAALVGFLALTAVLSVNFNVERLYRGAAAATPATGGPASVLSRLYAFAYGWQDALIERFVERRLRGASADARRAYHDRATVTILANLGLTTQLAAFGLCLATGRPLAFVWLLFGELVLVALLAVRREVVVRATALEVEPGGIT